MNLNDGYTLLELSISTAILSIIALMSGVALVSSVKSSSLNSAKEQMQANLRDSMVALTAEVRQAYTERTTESEPALAPEEAVAVSVIEGDPEEGVPPSISFTKPEASGDTPLPQPSGVITISLENEDVGDPPNARLDDGEDTNDDGALTRRLVRVDENGTTILGSANNISDARFTIADTPVGTRMIPNRLTIWLEASKRFGDKDNEVVRAELEATIQLEN